MSILAEKLPEAIYGSIEKSTLEEISEETIQIESDYTKKYKENERNKKKNLKDLRPNLSNPSCKEELDILNNKVIERFNRFTVTIDETQFKLLTCIQDMATKYLPK